MKPTYRPEIDGLRAVAVIPVILFHAGFDLFAGGYVGVDVFFVISGYLITTILLGDLTQDRFSLLNFYERRARRILPALFLVMIACLPFAWLWMTPDQLRDFGRSLVAVTVFASNFLFWLESGYFQAAAEIKPMLHTWSLAVEEQYYVLYPLLLMALWRFGRRASTWVIILIALLSFAIAQFGGNLSLLTDGDPATTFRWSAVPEHAFFLMPARAWELLLGALCALFLFDRPAGKPGTYDRVGAFVGLGLILYAIFGFERDTPFPGFFALVPTVGTALIILCATPGTAIARVLSFRPLVGIGLISYSAYLWHQPLFAFARLRTIGEVPVWEYLLLGAISLGLAWFSWRYVERPFRERDRMNRRQIFSMSLYASAIILAVGLSGHLLEGFKLRFDPQTVVKLESGTGGDSTGCSNARALFKNADADLCHLGANQTTARIAVLGDSHAASLSNALDSAGRRLGISVIPVNDNWCAPLYNFGTREVTRNSHCRLTMSRAIDRIISDPDIDTVFLVAEWANYTAGSRWGYDEVVAYTTSTAPSEEPDPKQNPEEFERAVHETLSRLTSKRVIIVKSLPEYHTRVPDTLAKATLFGDGLLPPQLRTTRKQYNQRNREVEQVWEKVSADAAEFIDTPDYLCASAECRYMTSGELLYMDDNHLSDYGATDFLKYLQQNLPAVFSAN